jgi:hypothetical protein
MTLKTGSITSPQLAVTSTTRPGSFEIQRIGSAARDRLKGTPHRYGIGDYFKFKVVALKEYFHVASVYESKQRRFYEQFCALKEALQAKSPSKIKDAYDGLIKIAHSWGPSDYQQPYEEAVLSILKEELSEQTTEDLLREIVLPEGTTLATDALGKLSLLNFTSGFEKAVQRMVSSHYGTEEEVKSALIEAAVRVASQEGSEQKLEEFISSLEGYILQLQTQSFAPAAEVEPYLAGLTEMINAHLKTGNPLTLEDLEKMESEGVFLLKNISLPVEWMAKLAQYSLAHKEAAALNQKTKDLYQQTGLIREEFARKREELETYRDYNLEEVIRYAGDGMNILAWEEAFLQKKELQEKLQRQNPGIEREQTKKALREVSEKTEIAFVVDRLRLRPEKDDSKEIKLTDDELLKLRQVATGPLTPVLAEAIARAEKNAVEIKDLQKEQDQTYQDLIATSQQSFEAKKPLFTQNDFPQEIIQSISLQIHEKRKSREKEKWARSLDIAHRLYFAKAQADLRAWETAFSSLTPSLRQSYLASGRIIVRFSPDQFRTIKCKELKERSFS